MWFRGEPSNSETPLTPRLFRDTDFRENYLLQEFRRKAPAYIAGKVPGISDTDQWLFLAQHYGLPTRLLDWTDNLFTAVFFALEFAKPAVYVLDPIALNLLNDPAANNYEFPITWIDNIGNANIKVAWGDLEKGTPYPVAIKPTLTDQRQALQSSCFTIFGSIHEELFPETPIGRLARIDLPRKQSKAFEQLHRYLIRIGIRQVSQFGDLSSLAHDIEQESRTFHT
jgi:hypothetical protein